MKLLQLDRKYLAITGIEPLQPFQNDQPLSVELLRRWLPLISFIVYVILSVVFLVYEAKTLNEYADTFYGTATTFGYSLILAIAIWKVNSLFKLIGDYEKRIEQCMENPESKQTYVKLNENVEKWTGILHFFLVKLTALANMMPHFSISFYLYFASDIGSGAFSLPFPIWAPFDWRTPFGFLIVFTFECYVLYFGCHICACYIVIFTASCYVVFTFCDEIKNEIHVLDESNKSGSNSADLMKKVGHIVEFHAATKQLVSDMDNIFAFFTITFFVWSLSTICSTLLVVQIGLEENANPLVLIGPLFRAFWSFVLLFLICEFGQILTEHFNQLTGAINDCDWSSFPMEIQKILPIIIQNTQREVVLETLKNASCSRESFKKVVNNGFSYFMVFRGFR